jgi:hypothetical protein
VLIDRNDLPKHLFGIPDLDLSDDLCAERLAGPWFRLGACSTGSGWDKQKFQDFGQTAESMGRENPDMLYKNYREVIKEQGTLMSSGNWFRPTVGRVSLPSMLPSKSGIRLE